MPGLVPGIHVFRYVAARKTWMAGTSPAMTARFERQLPIHMTSRTATLIGLTAILMWSLLSVLTVATGKIPAFQLAAMTFAIGAAVGFRQLHLSRPRRSVR